MKFGSIFRSLSAFDPSFLLTKTKEKMTCSPKSIHWIHHIPLSLSIPSPSCTHVPMYPTKKIKNPQSSPSPHKRHQRTARHHRRTSLEPPPADQDLITPIAQEILGEKFDQAGEQQQAAADGVHDADHEQAGLALGIVQAVDGEADGLADRGGGAVGEGHEPGLDAGGGQAGGGGGDAGAEGEAFEGLVEGDGEEEDVEWGGEGD